MGYVRFFRRARLAPGISLNLSGSGPSVSLGVRSTVGIPGTGLFYTSRQGWHSGVRAFTSLRREFTRLKLLILHLTVEVAAGQSTEIEDLWAGLNSE
ncbi:MAG TPA: DUF4236 domain-containing protein [Terriglobia bacterium]|nr:DUF4236 domain-containing protein [Terriglobia bacterium]